MAVPRMGEERGEELAPLYVPICLPVYLSVRPSVRLSVGLDGTVYVRVRTACAAAVLHMQT